MTIVCTLHSTMLAKIIIEIYQLQYQNYHDVWYFTTMYDKDILSASGVQCYCMHVITIPYMD